MSLAPQPAAPPLPVPRSRGGIGREAITATDGTVVGYDLRFTGTQLPDDALTDAEAAQAELLACKMIVSAFGEFGLERLGQRRTLFVNLPTPFATGRVPVPFGPENVVVQVLADVVIDEAALAGLSALVAEGYRLAVEAGCAGDQLDRLYPLIHVLRVPVAGVGDDLAELVGYLRGLVPQAQLLADGLAGSGDLQRAREAGFDLFQGVPADDPRPAVGVRRVLPSQVVSLQLLAALANPEVSPEELERIVSVDPGLSLRVLGAVNSAAGAGRKVGTLRQALVLLGRRSLGTWVMLSAFGSGSGDREQLVTVLTRARTCELMTAHVSGLDAPTAYVGGLMSGVVDVLGFDVQQTARDARLGEELTDALVARTGPLGRLVEAVESFDRAGVTPDSLPLAQVQQARLHALDEAVSAVDEVLGEV